MESMAGFFSWLKWLFQLLGSSTFPIWPPQCLKLMTKIRWGPRSHREGHTVDGRNPIPNHRLDGAKTL